MLIAAGAILPARADGLAITPATLPDGMEGVQYNQWFTATGGGDSPDWQWYTVPASYATAASTYQVGANETPLWEGRDQRGNGNVEYTLPFTFPFGGRMIDKVYVSPVGAILFEDDFIDDNYVRNSSLYYRYGIAVFWCDTSKVEAYVDTNVANEVSFRFESFSTGSGTWAARVTLKKDGTIRCAYRQTDNTFNGERVIGVAFSGNYLPVGAESDGIPATDIVFTTYGLPAGLQFSSGSWDPDTSLYRPCLYGKVAEACDVKFAVRVYDDNDSSVAATNFYSFSIVRNPNRPPVIDAYTPADTNTVIVLDIGDTLDFNVAVTDEAGGPFDVKWEFIRDTNYSSAPTVLGDETNFTFSATKELYDAQNYYGRSAIRCTVSDECWTNSVQWRAYIRTRQYADPSADSGTADGSEAHPWAGLPSLSSLKRGDVLTLAPGTYVKESQAQIGITGGVTLRSASGNPADTKVVFKKGEYIHGPSDTDRATIQGISFDGVTFYGCDLVDCHIANFTVGSSYDEAGIRCGSLTRCYVTGGYGQRMCYQTDVFDSTIAGNTLSTYTSRGDNYAAIGGSCTVTNSIIVNNFTLDGVEANVVTGNYTYVTMGQSCTIPARGDLGDGNFTAQPTFVSLAGGDLRLRVGSACIDAENPANNAGAYKGAGVEGFAVRAFCDPVRGTVEPALQVVAAGGSATITAVALTDRVFLRWKVNGADGETTPTLTLENITEDTEVEAVFEVCEFWVNPTEADDTGDGSAAQPKRTVAAAAALAISGETIRLAEGRFEPFEFSTDSWNPDERELTFLGAGVGKTIIDGGHTNTCVELAPNMVLKNASIINGAAKNVAAGGVYGGTIENCVVSNCTSYSYSTCYAAGAYNATIISSLIAYNMNTNATYGTYAAGVYNCNVYNSTIVDNVSSTSPGGAWNSYLKNSIVYGNTATANSDRNEIYNCRSDGDIDAANLIGVDPWFVDAANGDWRLIAGSPAIDAGGEVYGITFDFNDLAGNRRIQNGIIDYGCYEGGVVTGAPAAPVATGTSAKAGKGLPFVWSAVPNAAEYRIYRGTVNDATSATQVGTTTATNYLDLATTGGTDYFYWISAWNSQFGESEKCGPIAVTSYADLKIETASLPAATEAVPYSVQLECSGNVGAAVWSLPYAVVTREASTFDGTVGDVVGEDWPERSDSWQDNPVITLPFSFTWFGVSYDKVTISKFGGLYFGRNDNYLSWSSYGIDEYPKIAVNEGPYTSYYYVETSEWRVDSQPDHVTIIWKGTCDGETMEFSATLNADNTIRLAYGTIKAGAYVAFSNGSADTVTTVQPRLQQDCSGMDDIVITGLPNNSGLEISESGLLTGIIDYAGTYQVSALVTDSDNGDVAYKTFALTVNANPNQRPVIDSVTPAEGKVVIPVGDSQEFTVAARDPEGAALSYTWYLDGNALAARSTNLTFTATEADLGPHTLVCEVADAIWTNGQVYAEWDIVVGRKLYVDAVNGTTNGTGTAESPFKTLQQAEEWLSRGDTVVVAPGTYAPVRLWGWTDAAVVFRATGSAAETIIDGNGANICVDDWNCTKEITFIGFTLRNGGDAGVTGGGTGTASYGVNLKDCVVTGCTGGRCTIYGADVENCTIYGNTATRYGAAVGFCNVVNSLIYGNTSGGTGVVYRSTLDHCTVYGNTAMVGGGLDATSTATYSIVWGNTATSGSASANYEAGTQFDNSCTTPLPEGAGNIATDPLFVNAAGGDFHLADNSPCLAAGMGCYAEGGGEPVVTQFTVTFDANGGTCGETSRPVTSGQSVGTLPTPTRAGYTFVGWYTAKTGGAQVTASTKVTADVTWYARWTEITYTVTFDANGGTCAEASRQVAFGAAVGTLPTATRAGYTLAGWYTAKTGGSQVTASTKVTADVTWYARWTELPPAYTLTIEDGVLKGYTGDLPATLAIPATVTAFGTDLFRGVTTLVAATGGANVTKCGAGAFRDSGIWNAAANGPVVVCGVLVGWKGAVPATVDVPYGVKVIADGAFAGATSLATLYLPDSLVVIGDGAFRDCAKLDDVFGLEDGVTVADNAFEGTLRNTFRLTWSGTVVTGFRGPLPAALVIPANATGIGVDAFKGQTTITSLTIEGKNAVNVGAGAFEGCTALATATIGGGATIAATSFKGCAALQALTVGGSATIAAESFKDFAALKTVSIGGDAAIGASAFAGCLALETFAADGTALIGDTAFAGCTALKSASIGSASALGASAFAGCAALEAFELPEDIEEIGASTFEGCAALAAINLPTSVTAVAESAFKDCAALATVTGGENVRTIRTDAFAGTPWYETAPTGAFEEVMLGHVLVRLKGDVPASYEISSNVWMVANNALAGLTGLTDLYIGTEVVSLWDRAFAGCTSLTSVTVPSGCREFGDYLFEGCSSLETVFFRGHAPTNDVPHVFAGTPATMTVRIKEGSHGWEYPGSESDVRPARWPYQTRNGWRWQLVENDLNRAISEPEEVPGVVRSIIIDGTITNDTTWAGGKVYEVHKGCTVSKDATLTIEAGAIVKLPLYDGYERNRFIVYGKLVANGTFANPVVFTSIRDDSWGGDTNGDGNRSEPYPGECYGVCLPESGGGVSVQATYAKFLYGHAANYHGAHACLMCYNKEPSSFYGCEFSHAAMDGCFIAEARFENCIFTDCDRGFVSISLYGKVPVAVNCVAYDNRLGFCSHTGDMYLTNCIAAFNSGYGIGNDGCSVYSTRCCLWNPDGQNTYFKNSGRWVYNVDNIEADPLFLDAANGDFRISADSPCVDAAYGDVAPELDYWGQPRMDVRFVRNTGKPNAEGVYPDIGIYEVPGTTERPAMNLEVESVSFAATTIAPGETLTVRYMVRNTGAVAAKGSIRDTVRIKSAANGGTIVAGTVTQSYNLEPGGGSQFTATVTMPAAPAGDWFVGIDVNPNRDVFEQNMQKNSLWTENAVEVRLPEMVMRSQQAATLPAGATLGYVLSDMPEEGGVVVITGGSQFIATVTARVAKGHMPTVAMNDATSFVRADGALVLVVPPRAAGETMFLAVENTGTSSATVTIKVEPLTTQLWSVYPETAANVGDMGFTFMGAGLTAASEFSLGGIKAKSVSVIDSANVYAVFNVQNIAADRYYDVTADGKALRDAVYISKVAKGPVFDVKFDLPDRTRDNRLYTGYLVYENTGDTQMNAPTLIVNYALDDTNTVFGAYDDENDDLTQQRVLIMGLGASHPAGVLKPGDTGRLPFKFKPVGSFRFKVDPRYTADDVAAAATRLNLRGGPVRFDGYAARGLASLVKNGDPAAAVSGHLLDSRTRAPLAEAGLKLTLAGDDSFTRVVTTDANGYFSFEQLKDGAYVLAADTGYTLVTTNRIEVAGQADINGYEATALPPGTVSGYVMGADGTVVQYGDVTLFRSANDMEGTTVKTDGFGAYRFTGLEDGEYTIYAKPYEAFRGAMVTNVVVATATRERRLDFALSKAARAYGTVTRWKGGAAEDGEVRFYQADGNFLKAEVSTNGTWDAAGLAPGKYSVAYISTDGKYDSANAEVTFAAGDETEIPLVSQPATPFQASTSFGVIDASRPTLTVYFAAAGYANDTNVASVVWKFGDEGGKTYETNSIEIAHDYTSVGEFTVSARPRFADGTLGAEFAIENFLLVTNELETIYKDNAIVLGGYAPEDANFKKDAGTLVVTGVGEDFVTLSGAPGAVPLQTGTVIAGTYKDASGEDDWFLRRIVGVTGNANGWRLATEHGNEEDLYEQYWSYWSSGVEEQRKPPVQSNVSSNGVRRLAKLASIGDSAVNLLKKASGSFEKGIEFEVECSPDLQYHYSCRITSNVWRTVKRTMYGEQWEFRENIGPKRRELRIWGDVSLKADITANASFTGGWSDDKTYDLVPKAYQTIPSAAKAIPYFKIGYNASGSISGSAHASAEVNGFLDIGFVKESDKDIEWHKSKPFNGSVDISFDPDEDLDASISFETSVSAGFGVKVKAFEVVTAEADVMFNAKASIECPKNRPSRAAVSIGYDTNVSMNFIDLTWLNKDWKVGMDWTIEGPTLWSMEWISAWPKFTYTHPHSKEWPARITVTDRSERGTFADARGRTFPIPIESVTWDYGQGQTFSYGKAEIDSGAYKKHRVIEFPGDQEEGEYVVSLNVQGGAVPNLWPCQKKIKIKKPEEPEDQTKIKKEEWFETDGERFSSTTKTQKSVDPNEMAGPEGTGEQRYVKPGDWMNYIIYFENKADAATAAQEIWIDNQLSQYLDWSTFEMGEVSLAGQIDYGLVGMTLADLALLGGAAESEIDQTNGLYKSRTEVQFDAATGAVGWYFRVVDAAKRASGDGECWPDDPDAGVLNPNVTVPEGEGYVTYRVRVREDAPGNTRIDNSATIVFDYNDPIVTDPAWWNTVYEMVTIPVTVDGVTTNLRFVVGAPYGELPTPAPRDGWTFEGWFTGPNGTGRRVTADTLVRSGDKLYAYWTAIHRLYDEVTGAAPTDAASEYNGYLVDTNSNVVAGTIQVKVGKPNKKTWLAAVKATVQPAEGKKLSLKAAEKGKAEIAADGPTTVDLVGTKAEPCRVVLGAKGLSGNYGKYAIRGTRNFFTSKDKAEQAKANGLLEKWLGAVNVVWDGGTVGLTVGKKGKVKATVILNDGTKATANGLLLVGEEWCCIPVVEAKKAKLAIVVWLPNGAGELAVDGLGEAIVGKAGALGANAAFHVGKDATLWSQLAGTVLSNYLPDGVPVVQNGAKWTLPKAGKIAMKVGVLDNSKAGENAAALKLTYKAKDGSFKGSFKVYTDVGGKLKTAKVTVTGVMVNGKGYGAATIKKVGGVPVEVE